MMSSQYYQRSLIEVLDLGADDFIGKPPLAEELYARLRAAERNSVYAAARFDPARHNRSPDRFEQSARFLRAGAEACARVPLPDGSLSAIILDIDNFKHINNSTGTRPATRRSAAARGPRS